MQGLRISTRRESSPLLQWEKDYELKKQASDYQRNLAMAQTAKFEAEAREGQYKASATLLRQRRILLQEGTDKDEVDLLLPLPRQPGASAHLEIAANVTVTEDGPTAQHTSGDHTQDTSSNQVPDYNSHSK
jgi:hypothetical protein